MCLTSGSVKGESGVCVVEVPHADIVDGFSVVQLQKMSVVGQPGSVPIVDAVKVAGVVQAVVARGNGAQILGHEHVQGGNSLKMDRVVVIVGSVERKK